MEKDRFRLENEINIVFEQDEETGQVVASAPELNYLSSYGNSKEEAEANIKESIFLFMNSLDPKTDEPSA